MTSSTMNTTGISPMRRRLTPSLGSTGVGLPADSAGESNPGDPAFGPYPRAPPDCFAPAELPILTPTSIVDYRPMEEWTLGRHGTDQLMICPLVGRGKTEANDRG